MLWYPGLLHQQQLKRHLFAQTERIAYITFLIGALTLPFLFLISQKVSRNNNPSHSHYPCTLSPIVQRSPPCHGTSRNMSGYLSPDAEAALWGHDGQGRRVYYQNQAQSARYSGQPSSSPYQMQYTASSTMTSPQTQLSQQAYAAPAQYVSWPSSNWPLLQPAGYGRGQHASLSTSTPVLPSSPYSPSQQWSNSPWPTLHPDDVEASSDTSRSVSPSPADLHNFGIPLPDGRSWRCAYPHCSSQAVFTRGCDLRKHFRRHTKTLFCRQEGCPQSREGGFSSKKDRDRHESRHAPQIHCTHQGCDRVFSRADNMKDHVRRIHRKNA